MGMQTLTKGIEHGFYAHLLAQRDDENRHLGAVKAFSQECERNGVAPDTADQKETEAFWLERCNVRPWEHQRREKVKRLARVQWQLAAVFREQKAPLWTDEGPTMEKAFSLSTLQVIFPIFYDTQIMAGILAMPILDVLVMDTVQINAGIADHAAMNESVTDRQFGEAGEWTTFSEINISATNAPIKLHKFGGILHASDEAVRRARIPVFARGVERIGRQLGIDLTDFGLDVMLNGDGNAGAATTTAATTTGAPTYNDYLKLFYAFPLGYEPTDLIAHKNSLQTMLNIPEFKDPLAGFKFQNSAVLPEPMGLMAHRWDSQGSSTWSTTNVLAVQRNRALIMYQEGGLSTESERVLNGEFTRIKTSLYVGFGIWDPNARQQGTGFSV